MKIDIWDAAAVQAIRPLDAALYLRARGRRTPHVETQSAATWQTTIEGEQYEALLPLDGQLRD